MNHLTKDELKALLRAIPQPRHKLMVLVTYNHGLRVSETINLTGASIRDGFVSVQRLKGSLKTVQPFIVHPDPELDESKGLIDLVLTVKKDEKLFPITRTGFYLLMQRAGKRAGIPQHKAHPHSLKHSCALHHIKGAGIEAIRQYLGHRSLGSTGAYLRISDEEASRAIFKSLVGRDALKEIETLTDPNV